MTSTFNKEECAYLTQAFNFNAVAPKVSDGFHFAVAVEAGASLDYDKWADANDKSRQNSFYTTVEHSSHDPDRGLNVVLFKSLNTAKEFHKVAFGIPEFGVLDARVNDNKITLRPAPSF